METTENVLERFNIAKTQISFFVCFFFSDERKTIHCQRPHEMLIKDFIELSNGFSIVFDKNRFMFFAIQFIFLNMSLLLHSKI